MLHLYRLNQILSLFSQQPSAPLDFAQQLLYVCVTFFYLSVCLCFASESKSSICYEVGKILLLLYSDQTVKTYRACARRHAVLRLLFFLLLMLLQNNNANEFDAMKEAVEWSTRSASTICYTSRQAGALQKQYIQGSNNNDSGNNTCFLHECGNSSGDKRDIRDD